MSLNLDRNTWTRVKFGEVIASVSDRVDDPSQAGVDRYVGLEHLDPGSMTITRWGTPDQVEAQKLRFRAGDVIFGRRRAYQKKVARADFEGICSAHALVLRAKPGRMDPDFLPVFLSSDVFLDRAVRISVGSLSPTVNWKTLAVQEFVLPPIVEQRRVADLLWAVEKSRSSARSLRDAVAIARDAFVDAVMDDFGSQGTVVNLDSLIEEGRPITYGILMPGLSVEDGVPVVKVRDFPNGYINTADLLLTSPEIDAAYTRSRLRPGDLLISIRGTVGRLAEVPASLDGANITQDTARLSVDPRHSTAYVRLALGSRSIQALIARAITGLAVKGINIGALRAIPIPVPPSKEAEEDLVTKATSLDQTVQQLDREVASLESLRQQLLVDALGGEG